MNDLESHTVHLVADTVSKIDRNQRPAFCKAAMRLFGNALAIHTSHDEAAETHIGLGRQHHQRTGRAR